MNRKINKNINVKLVALMLVFTISIFIQPVYAAPNKILQIVPGDYSFRSGLELKTQYYEGMSTLLKEDVYFWDSEVPLLEDMNKDYSNLFDLYSDTIPWRAKAIVEYDPACRLEGDVDFTIAIVPRLQGKMTKLCTGGACERYFVEYEYDNHSNIKTTHSHGTIVGDVVKTYEDDVHVYAHEDWTLNSQLTRLKGSLNTLLKEETPWDNVITKTNYQYEIDTLYEELNMVTLPSDTITTDISGRVLSYTEYDYENTIPHLEDCDAHMFYPNHAIQGPLHYGGLLENVYDYGGIKGHISFDELYTKKNFTYDECGNPLSTTTEGPYTSEGGMRVTTPSYGVIDYDDIGYAFPEIASNLGNSTANPSISVSAEYYTFDTDFIEPLPPTQPVPINLYDVRSDKIKKITDENGQITEYEYDELGRLTKVIRPGDETDFTLKYDYIYDPTPTGNWKVLAQQKINDVQVLQAYYFYDGLGRLKQTQLKKDASTIIVSDIKYDNLGRKYLESKPREVTAAFGTYLTPTWDEYIEYHYDALDRIVNITYPNGDWIYNEYHDYENRVRIYDENNHSKDYYYDAFSNLITVEEQQT